MKTIKKKILMILKDQKGQTESNTVFFLIVVAIVAIILIAVVKPMFNKSVKTSAKQAALPSQTIPVE
ncbi:hypothetical protein GW835_02100 [archaeon]|jgi:uncharacterized protein (UPF0333 family)|nr:hypothetical protein [archaeon]NCP79338.1 hypothetical protein [archaeon]NCP97281.1 hypothetical protein [archaeon]NCQ07105.1 hypothetical protein [archaeon]NCQ50901.1 hypothetical protein [archaeon]